MNKIGSVHHNKIKTITSIAITDRLLRCVFNKTKDGILIKVGKLLPTHVEAVKELFWWLRHERKL